MGDVFPTCLTSVLCSALLAALPATPHERDRVLAPGSAGAAARPSSRGPDDVLEPSYRAALIRSWRRTADRDGVLVPSFRNVPLGPLVRPPFYRLALVLEHPADPDASLVPAFLRSVLYLPAIPDPDAPLVPSLALGSGGQRFAR